MVSKTFKARVDWLFFMMRHPYGPDSVRKTRAAQRTMLTVGQPHRYVKFLSNALKHKCLRLESIHLKNFMKRKTKPTQGGRKSAVASFQV